ncbi:uncharacterized protein [Clytia hemisphaerica]|uniref:uncharacterized protein n=1 Tax=Clytia hemisphaerica TaxID=252671 RepID=UPI0034D3BE3F
MAAAQEVLEQDYYTLDKVYGLLESGFFDTGKEDDGQDHFDLETIGVMMDNGVFDDVDEIKNEIESMESELSSLSNESSFACDVQGCDKVCKTKGGIKRHKQAKHPDDVLLEKQQIEQLQSQQAARLLHPLDIKKNMKKALENIKSDENFPATFREGFNLTDEITGDQGRAFFRTLKDDILKFERKKDLELFLQVFKEKLNTQNDTLMKDKDNSKESKKQNEEDQRKEKEREEDQKYINELKNKFSNIQAYQLFLFEVAALCLATLQEPKESSSQETNKTKVVLAKREIESLEYLTGHVFHKIYLKLRKNRNYWKVSFQQMIALICEFKVEATEEQKFIHAKDRGGLWYTRKEAIAIFHSVELIFRNFTKKKKMTVRKIDYKLIKQNCVKNIEVRINFDKVLKSHESAITKDLAYDLLDTLVGLYIRIRAHSYAKNVREKFKLALKLNRQKSLREELKRASNDDPSTC